MKTFQAHETAWLLELDGIELADFWQRAVAFFIDACLALFIFLFVLLLIAASVKTWNVHHGGSDKYAINIRNESRPEELLTETLVPAIYFGLSTWLGKGRSPGKWLMRIRVVSLVHRHLTLWHAIERALGYAAAALEFGFGFAQFFIHPYRRTVQDRIAETIVVKERSFQRFVIGRTRSEVAVLEAEAFAAEE